MGPRLALDAPSSRCEGAASAASMSGKEVWPTMLHSIICGVDGSETSRSAAQVAARLAATLNTRFVLAHVTEDRPIFPYGDPRLRELQRRRANEDGQRLLESVAAELPGATPELRVTFGTPVEALRALCGEEPAELLVVGSRGRSRLAAAVLGSVSARLASTAECPVIVVSTRAAATRFLAHETNGGPIVCGLDASPESKRALEVAADLGDRCGSRSSPFTLAMARTRRRPAASTSVYSLTLATRSTPSADEQWITTPHYSWSAREAAERCAQPSSARCRRRLPRPLRCLSSSCHSRRDRKVRATASLGPVIGPAIEPGRFP